MFYVIDDGNSVVTIVRILYGRRNIPAIIKTENYHESLMGFGKRELIDMADKIAAMSDVYSYMSSLYYFSDEEVEFYMLFRNPLEIVVDAWCEHNADNEDLCFTLNN